MEFAAICSKKYTPPDTLCRSTCPSAPTGAPTSCAASRTAQPIAGSSCAACSPNPDSPASEPPDPRRRNAVDAVEQGGVCGALRLFLCSPACATSQNQRDRRLSRDHSICNVEVHDAIWRLMVLAVHRLQHQAIASRSEIFHLHLQPARNNRIAFLNEVIRRRQPAKKHVLIRCPLVNVVSEAYPRRRRRRQPRLVNLRVQDHIVAALESVACRRHHLHFLHHQRSAVLQQRRIQPRGNV